MTVSRAIIFLALALQGWAQHAPIPRASARAAQHSNGTCSPNIQDVRGNITIQFFGGACGGLDPVAIRRLNEFLADFPKTQHRLEELLEKKDEELVATVKEAEDWANKYRGLSERLQAESPDDELSRKAASLLADNDLDDAERILSELVDRDHKRADQVLDQLARDEFNLAEAYSLKFEPLQALPHYEQAYRTRPNTFAYALAYAKVLWKQNQFSDADKILEDAVKMVRQRAKTSPTYLADLAQTLNALAVLYSSTQRVKESEQPSKPLCRHAKAERVGERLSRSSPDSSGAGPNQSRILPT